ncbi:MAG TPA: hypothetical protein VJS63_15810 [Bradyrhizobium sp.]|nr:hypothetical protein [Bradyrhizobium sp.]
MSTPVPTTINTDANVLPGRMCGSCTLCCKVYNIPEFGKPAGKWCQHCKPGKGCTIHDALPDQCAVFNCLWRTEESIPLNWKPEQSKMVVTIFPLNYNVYVQVDPGAPGAWRKQPYYGNLQNWAKNNLPKGIYVVVFVNEVATLILPDQEILLGPMKPTDKISLRRTQGSAKYEATLIPGGEAGS